MYATTNPMDPDMRSFKLVNLEVCGKQKRKHIGGRYLSRSPGAAAAKVLRIVRMYTEGCKPKSIVVTMEETTRGSAHALFRYRVSCTRSKTAVINGQEMTFKCPPKVKALPLGRGTSGCITCT